MTTYTVAPYAEDGYVEEGYFATWSTSVIHRVDVPSKRIFLKIGVRTYHPVTDIYREMRFIRRTDVSLRKIDMPVLAEGNLPKGGGKFTPRYAIFRNGWRIVPADETHTLYISGEQITDDGQSGPAIIDTTPLSTGTNVTLHYEPPSSELVRADEEIAALQKAAYFNKVVLDKTFGVAGTLTPIGTQAKPVNNVPDLRIIASEYGIGTVQLQPGNYTFGAGEDLSGFVVYGEHAIRTMVTIGVAADAADIQLRDVFLVNSTLDGNAYISHTFVSGGLYGFYGFMESSMISGVVVFENTQQSFLIDCKSACVGLDTTDIPIFDMNAGGLNIAVRNWSGPVKIANSTDINNTICIDVVSGASVIIDSSCTAGTIIVRGIANIINEGAMTVTKEANMNTADIVNAVNIGALDLTEVLTELSKVERKVDDTQAMVLSN